MEGEERKEQLLAFGFWLALSCFFGSLVIGVWRRLSVGVGW